MTIYTASSCSLNAYKIPSGSWKDGPYCSGTPEVGNHSIDSHG